MAALKYMFYSIAGALLVLFGFFVFAASGNSLTFAPGGVLDVMPTGFTLFAVFCMILGFGTKAGMFPMHGWLPTAHPVAPAPASAVLSGIITKAGVLGIIRVVFYIAGPDLIRGTWVQYVWMCLALITVFMGSMLALKEDIFKKRLAYSSVSQVSYILFALATLTAAGFQGALLHVLFHSAIKITLFMTAGAVIVQTGLTHVSDMKGLGKRMPLVLVLFTVVSLGLIGIPPSGGFVSKWWIASGAMELSSAFAFLGPATLLLSAILTAAYLLTISIQGFFPGKDVDTATLSPASPGPLMWIPMLLLSLLVLLGGMFPESFLDFFAGISASLML